MPLTATQHAAVHALPTCQDAGGQPGSWGVGQLYRSCGQETGGIFASHIPYCMPSSRTGERKSLMIRSAAESGHTGTPPCRVPLLVHSGLLRNITVTAAPARSQSQQLVPFHTLINDAHTRLGISALLIMMLITSAMRCTTMVGPVCTERALRLVWSSHTPDAATDEPLSPRKESQLTAQ